jgi:tRNA-dihydrouridine synthase B
VLIYPPLFQAPLLDYTHYCFRMLVRQLGGVGLTVTELVHARGLIEQWRREKVLPQQLWGVELEPPPVAVQLWDSEPRWIVEAVRLVLDQVRPTVIDLNFGCPSYQVSCRSGGGAGLLKQPWLIGQLVEAAVQAAGQVPVTVKIRLGWDPLRPVAGQVARIAEEAGASAVAVHGRYATQKMSGRADWEAIAAVRSCLRSIPLIGNGDIASAESAVEALARWPVDGVMIGRAGVARPWIFREILALLSGQPKPPAPTPLEEQHILLGHLDRLREQLSPHRALILGQKFACRFGAGRRGAGQYRLAVSQCRSIDQLRQVVERLFPMEVPRGPRRSVADQPVS